MVFIGLCMPTNVTNKCISRALMATIRFLTDYPCPHCFVLKSQIVDLGLVEDMEHCADVQKFPAMVVKNAQKRIFEKGRSVNYKGIKDKLTDSGSWVPMEVGSVCFLS